MHFSNDFGDDDKAEIVRYLTALLSSIEPSTLAQRSGTYEFHASREGGNIPNRIIVFAKPLEASSDG